MVKLPDEYLKIVIECIKLHVPSYQVLAYGSRVKGTAHSASDLDLVIRNMRNSTQQVENFYDFKEALSESNLPILVDVLDWSKIPESFKQEIEANHIQIWP